MELQIEPLDTLFFRDGKPFSMGEETWADSHLLPSPSVIYGMLRTAIATQNNIGFDKIKDEVTGEMFSINSIYYRLDDETRLPLPLDLVEYKKPGCIANAEKEEEVYEVKPLDLISTQKAIFSHEKVHLKYFPVGKGLEQVKTLDNGLLVRTDLDKYLSGELESTKAKKLTDYITSEPKIGIARDNSTRSADEGRLYRVDMKRARKFKIGVNFNLADNFVAPVQIQRMGGDGKLVQLITVSRPAELSIRNIDFSKKRFKIYFATPAILHNGQPSLLKLNINAQLVAACVGKPIHLGGFDLQEGQAKPMYRVIPAGSVFYYETQNDVSELNQKQGLSLSDKQSEQGFGIAYFGTWTPQNH